MRSRQSWQRTCALSLDHLVGAGEKRGRNVEVDYPRGLSIDDKLKLGRLHYRHVYRLGALEDATRINADLTKSIRQTRSVAYQPADFNALAHSIYRGYRVACCQLRQLDTTASEKRAGVDEEGTGSLPCEGREGCVNLTTVVGVDDLGLQSHCRCSSFHIFQRCLGNRCVSRTDEHRNTIGRGHQFTQEFQA